MPISPSWGSVVTSMPGSWSVLPSTSTSPSCTGSTAATPGTWRICSTTESGRPASPCWPESTKKSPWNWLSMVWLTDAVAEAAKMLKKAMSPTPIMSAAAVDAVRRGLRTAFCRARRPVTPLNLTTGAPITRLIGPAMIGPSTATPRKVSMAPPPTIASPLLRWPNSPRKSTATPPPRTRSPRIVRRRELPARSTAVVRRAAMGGTREARRAGATATTRVTPIPAMSATTIERPLTTVPLAGMPKPTAPSRLFRPTANATPSTRPSTAEMMPTTSASPSTAPRTCRRLAPSARSKASSRVRWATMIEKVL